MIIITLTNAKGSNELDKMTEHNGDMPFVYQTPSKGEILYVQVCLYACMCVCIHSFIHSFIQTISIAPLQVNFYSESLPTQHGYCAGVSRRSATGNCELRT